MHPRFALALLAIALAPLALAAGGGDIVTTGGLSGAGLDMPQLYCAGVLGTAHSEDHPLVCDAEGPASGVTILRLRIVMGAGHAYAWADDVVSQQFGFLDCRSTMSVPPVGALPAQLPGGRACATVISTGAGLSGRFGLHFAADGPAGLVVEAQLERMDVPLP